MPGQLSERERRRLIVEYYDSHASSYGSEYQETIAGRYFLRQKLRILRGWAGIAPPMKVLEVGCANGWYTTALKALGHDIRAVDIAEENVVESRRRTGSLGYDIDFRQGDVENLHFVPSDSIDAAFSFSTLRYVPNIPRALQELHRVLKPGGRLLVDFPNRRSPFFLFVHRHCRRYVPPRADECDIKHSRREAYAFVERAGFRDVEEKTGLFIARTTPDLLAYPFIAIDVAFNAIPLIRNMGGAVFVKARK